MGDPFYITTAISYPNGRPHIGHAYEAIAADAIARFQRQAGRDVFFQTGTDEHGLKMAQAARAQDRPVAEYAAEMSSHFREMCDVLQISYDRFIRTTEPAHHLASQALWAKIEKNGDLYLDLANGEIYRFDGTSWGDQGYSLIGPTGPAGSAGLRCTQIFTGSGPFVASNYANPAPAAGDLYLDTASANLFVVQST